VQSKDAAQSTVKDQNELTASIQEVMKISEELDSRVNLVNKEVNNISSAIQEVSAKNQEIVSTANILLEEQQ